MTTITDLLRQKDMCLKKADKDSTKPITHVAVVGDSKPQDEFRLATSYYQSVFDQLKNICALMHKIRTLNLVVKTQKKNFYTKENMTISECRSNIVGNKNVGMPSGVYYMKELANHILKQMQTINDLVKRHNETENGNLKKMLDTEYSNHIRERDAMLKVNATLEDDRETTYQTRVKMMTDAFWKKNKAVHVDPTNVCNHVNDLLAWITDFEKTRELSVNKANNDETKQIIDVAMVPPVENENVISLEELNSLIKDYSSNISTEISRLCMVTMKVGEKEVENQSVMSAGENLARIHQMIEAYEKMQHTFKFATTFTFVGTNPLTSDKMFAGDVVDFQHIVLPFLTRMISLFETTKTNCDKEVKEKTQTAQSEGTKLIENSMNSASSRPPPEKLKEYRSALIESMTPKILVANGVDTWIETYRNVVDSFAKVKTLLSVANANTRVPITWKVSETLQNMVSWDNVDKMEELEQTEVVTSAPKTLAPIHESTEEESFEGFGRGRGRARGRGKNERWGRNK